MKNELNFNIFEGANPHKLQNFLDQCCKGSWQLNPDTNKIDVQGDFKCSNKNLLSLKGTPFGVVSGEFDCSQNGMTTLEGCPEQCFSFKCNSNKLTNLLGGPKKVKASYVCNSNSLTSLEGAPDEVLYFNCSDNKELQSLEGCPPKVDRISTWGCGLTNLKGISQSVKTLDCSRNKISSLYYCPENLENLQVEENLLTSLKGVPEKMEYLRCSSNQITTLVGGPQEVLTLSCWSNLLTNLVGAPKKLEYFDCDLNPLTSLEGCPQIITDSFRFTIPGSYANSNLSFRNGSWPQPNEINKWAQILDKEMEPGETQLLLTHPDLQRIFDYEFWRERVDKEKGPALLDLAYLWDVKKFEETRQEIEQKLEPLFLKQIKALIKFTPYLKKKV
jgi:hypothetical protein